ncbi:MAG TPA: hypothetical protein VNC22_13310, partial [Sporichthya sp.]|nr:hypothetical protein [Sporichthya sp.]
MPRPHVRVSRLAPLTVAAAALLIGPTLAPPAATAADRAGAPFAWGANNLGQSGGTSAANPAYSLPVGIQGLNGGVIDVAAGDAHSLALLANGSVFAWGNDSFGQVGNDAAFTKEVST